MGKVEDEEEEFEDGIRCKPACGCFYESIRSNASQNKNKYLCTRKLIWNIGAGSVFVCVCV